ncbi:hypothetical protein LNKW23_05850 [Paralimibaculum aggregatum]|uniref:Uncharacterized protein n=1 Tax=Paralimibaculum aggregatum TaxID=3036245 RepID=A0ABQ6LEH2_9RHOB|nr:hypothetical protein [Limibaculum sp. NKW23]GMG81372.1 hypothetical protein LNKW23_05850 [Limibaculum sp. NKW23]
MAFTRTIARRALLTGTAALTLVAALPGVEAEAKTRGMPKPDTAATTAGEIAALDADANASAVLARLLADSPAAAGIMGFPTVEANAFQIGSETAIGRLTAGSETSCRRATGASLDLQIGSRSLSRGWPRRSSKGSARAI